MGVDIARAKLIEQQCGQVPHLVQIAEIHHHGHIGILAGLHGGFDGFPPGPAIVRGLEPHDHVSVGFGGSCGGLRRPSR